MQSHTSTLESGTIPRRSLQPRYDAVNVVRSARSRRRYHHELLTGHSPNAVRAFEVLQQYPGLPAFQRARGARARWTDIRPCRERRRSREERAAGGSGFLGHFKRCCFWELQHQQHHPGHRQVHYAVRPAGAAYTYNSLLMGPVLASIAHTSPTLEDRNPSDPDSLSVWLPAHILSHR